MSDTLKFGRRYRCNDSFFFREDIGTEGAWLLGYIAADGSPQPHGVSLQVNKRDRDGLAQVRRILQSTHPIALIRTRPNMLSLQLTRQRLTFGVRQFGIAAGEKNLVQALDTLNPELHSAFWLGVFDGDGWVTTARSVVHIIVGDNAEVLGRYLQSTFALSRVAVYAYSGSSTAVSELVVCRKDDVDLLARGLLAAYPYSLSRKRKTLMDVCEKED